MSTPEQNAQMASMLDEAMRNGSLGLSTNLMDNDQHHRPIPSRVADDAEFEALFDVLARYPGAIVIPQLPKIAVVVPYPVIGCRSGAQNIAPSRWVWESMKPGVT